MTMPPIEFVGRLGVTIRTPQGQVVTVWQDRLASAESSIVRGAFDEWHVFGWVLSLDEIRELRRLIAERNKKARRPAFAPPADSGEWS